MFKTLQYYKHLISGLIESRPNGVRSRQHPLLWIDGMEGGEMRGEVEVGEARADLHRRVHT
jgi:hypothetical protein